jgi:hypothetical protein
MVNALAAATLLVGLVNVEELKLTPFATVAAPSVVFAPATNLIALIVLVPVPVKVIVPVPAPPVVKVLSVIVGTADIVKLVALDA